MVVLSYKLWESVNSEIESLAVILRTYAQASPVATEVTPLTRDQDSIAFRVFTDIPSDNFSGNKNFYVVVKHTVSNSYVEIMDDEKEITKVSLEAKAEHNTEVIIRNFIEIAELYDDPIIQHIISKHRNVSSPEDIQKLLQIHDTSHQAQQ